MKKNQFAPYLLGVVLAAVLFVFAYPALAGNVERVTVASELTGNAPLATSQMDVKVVPAAAFSSDGFYPDSYFFPFGGGFIQGKVAADGCIKAPLHLETGARIAELWTTVYDNDSSLGRDIWVNVRRVAHETGFGANLLTATTDGMPANTSLKFPSDLTPVYPDEIVDTSKYAYYVTTCVLSSEIRIYSARVYYYYPPTLYLPTIVRP